MGFPEVTAAYRQLRDVREVGWKKDRPAFSKRLACNGWELRKVLLVAVWVIFTVLQPSDD